VKLRLIDFWKPLVVLSAAAASPGAIAADPQVDLKTSVGTIRIELYPGKAPKTVENFVKLAKDGFYDGTQFHRIIKGFMIQGGCPNTKAGAKGEPGSGSPGYTLKGEFNDTKHVRGVLSMARSGHPDSAGCQFFICHGTAPHLDPVPGVPNREGYTAFAMLDSGFDVLDQIANTRVKPNAQGEPSVPIEPVHLYSAIVLPVLKGK
jgi:peptidyl-prolyl cis-trans isomerase B (cyclophilin B)